MTDAKVNKYLVLGALPLLAYGGVLPAGVMGLAALHGSESFALVFISKAFIYGSFAYPAVYLVSLFRAYHNVTNKEPDAALRWSLVPLAYLLIVGVFFALWLIFWGLKA